METKTRVAAIIINKGKLLMLKGRGYDELWTPGGKIEPGETEEDCLKREVAEEIGVKIKDFNFFKEYSGKSFYQPSRITKQKIYIVSISGEIKPDKEIESYIWLTREDFDKKRFSMIPITEKKIIPDLIEQGIF